jgi:hypothetical protein
VVDPKYIITLKDRQFVLFAGLLDLAHRCGLKGIETSILLPASNPAEQFWVVQATGRFAGDGEDVLYWAHGDAGPQNSQMRGAYLRHAETRSIARMLRLATNVGMAAFEELGPDALGEGEGNGRGAAPRPAAAKAPAATTGGSPVAVCQYESCGQPLTANQVTLSMHHHATPLCPAHCKAMDALKQQMAAAK